VPLFIPHFNLQKCNTLASPVTAHYFVLVKTEAEILEAIQFSRAQHLPLLVLGGGSNIVLCDDFCGLVMRISLQGRELVAEDDSYYYVKAAAGEEWHGFVSYCLACHYWGLENLSLIPGSVGAAPIQNIGAYGVELQDIFFELTAIEIQSGLSVTFTKDACDFKYRDSIFKGELKDRYIITSVTFKLFKNPALHFNYPALQVSLSEFTRDTITPEIVSELVCDIRKSKLPDPHKIPNVGSFFKNPVISSRQLAEIQKKYPDVVNFPAGVGHVKLAAAWLIERAGWKGFSDGYVAVHDQQALVITNPNCLKGDAVIALANRIQQSVFQLFTVTLEVEPRIYP
jgi:UDP-N-acetylmuramate dehydrogenase